jgi:hypothetical protein
MKTDQGGPSLESSSPGFEIQDQPQVTDLKISDSWVETSPEDLPQEIQE